MRGVVPPAVLLHRAEGDKHWVKGGQGRLSPLLRTDRSVLTALPTNMLCVSLFKRQLHCHSFTLYGTFQSLKRFTKPHVAPSRLHKARKIQLILFLTEFTFDLSALQSSASLPLDSPVSV